MAFSVTKPDRDTFIDDPVDLAYNSYYVVVSGADPDNDFGDYAIEIALSQTDDHPDAGQFEFATPIPIAPETGLGEDTGDIEIDTDTDLFRFVAPAGGTATIEVANADSSLLRPRVRVFDSSFTEITSGDGPDIAPGGTSTASVSFSVVREEEYYVLVEGVASVMGLELSGAYDVTIGAPPKDDHANENEFEFATKINLAPTNGRRAGERPDRDHGRHGLVRLRRARQRQRRADDRHAERLDPPDHHRVRPATVRAADRHRRRCRGRGRVARRRRHGVGHVGFRGRAVLRARRGLGDARHGRDADRGVHARGRRAAGTR